MASAADMAEQFNLVIRTNTRVTNIDAAAKKVFVGEEPIEYSKLVLAWGAEASSPRMEGDAGDCIFSINDLQDYAKFRDAAEGKKRVLIMGAGLIGAEFANDMATGGFEIDVVAPCEHILTKKVTVNLEFSLTQAKAKRLVPILRPSCLFVPLG